MADFFISYTSADKAWAEWIGFVLEEEGFTVAVQAWDFRPGSNFVLEMQKAASEADRTILVLSPDYLTSQFASSEWASAFAQDPQGLDKKLLPIIVRDCQPGGLLRPVVHINLIGVGEAAARDRLTQGVSAKRAKPSQRPAYPGTRKPPVQKVYPGALSLSARPSAAAVYMPSIKHAASDMEKRQFIKLSFELISSHFQAGLTALGRRDAVIEHDFELNTATEFTAEIFVHGKSICRCRVWRGGLHSQNGISYAEGATFSTGGGCNEILTIQDSGPELHLVALMAAAYSQTARVYDTKRLTQEHAADYLWRRFVEPLER